MYPRAGLDGRKISFPPGFDPGSYLDGDRGSTVVKELCYKSEGRWFDSDSVIGIFH